MATNNEYDLPDKYLSVYNYPNDVVMSFTAEQIIELADNISNDNISVIVTLLEIPCGMSIKTNLEFVQFIHSNCYATEEKNSAKFKYSLPKIMYALTQSESNEAADIFYDTCEQIYTKKDKKNKKTDCEYNIPDKYSPIYKYSNNILSYFTNIQAMNLAKTISNDNIAEIITLLQISRGSSIKTNLQFVQFIISNCCAKDKNDEKKFKYPLSKIIYALVENKSSEAADTFFNICKEIHEK